MGLPAARIGDMHTCPMVDGTVPHVGGPVDSGCPTVVIGGMPSARISDTLVCVGPPDVIATGATQVLIGGMPAARITDMTAHGGVIVVGCPTVLIGSPDDDSDDENSDGQSDQSTGTGGGGAPGEQSGSGAGGSGYAGGDGEINVYDGPINSNPNALSASLTAIDTPPSFGEQVVDGLGAGFVGGITDTVNSLMGLGETAYKLSTSAQARADAVNQFQALSAMTGNGLKDLPGTAKLTASAVQNAANAFLKARQAAYDSGRGAAFDAKLVGRGAFEAAVNFLPGAAAHRFANLWQGAREAGISMSTARKLQALAEATGDTFIMRPTNPAAKKLIARGWLAKPAELKAKTISPIDRLVGAPKGVPDGEVGFFKPTLPDRALLNKNPKLYGQAIDQYIKRSVEYHKYLEDMEKLQAAGKIRMEGGRVFEAKTGKAFAGDNDLFDIRHADGSALTPEEMEHRMGLLRQKPVDVQHGGVMQWDTAADEKPLEAAAMKRELILDHTSIAGGGRGKPLVAIGPKGYFRTYADHW